MHLPPKNSIKNIVIPTEGRNLYLPLTSKRFLAEPVLSVVEGLEMTGKVKVQIEGFEMTH